MAADERQAVSNIQIALHRQPVGKYDVVLVYFDVPRTMLLPFTRARTGINTSSA